MPSLRILTLNLWHRSEPYAKRLAAMRTGIADLAPDVIGLQEVMVGPSSSQLVDLAEHTTYTRAAFAAAHESEGADSFGNGALSRFPIDHAERLMLPACGQSPRVVLFALVSTPHGRLPFFSTHLHYKAEDGWVREEQVRELAKLVDDASPKEKALPAVIVGDFNASPDSAEIRFLRGLQSLKGRSTRWFDSFEYAGSGPGITFDEKNNPFAADWPDMPARIDYVFVRTIDDRGRGRPVEARVVLDQPIGGVHPSDHYGVFVELAV